VTELMKNQFYDTDNYSTLEIVCSKQKKSCLLTEKRYAIYNIYGSTCFAAWGESALGLNHLYFVFMWTVQYGETTIYLECSGRAHDLWLGFGLQFTQCRKEAAKSLPCQYWNHDKIHSCISNWAIGDAKVN